MSPTWKWGAGDVAYLTAKGESSACPRARVYSCAASPRGSRFRWTVTVNGTSIAVCRDTVTAMRIGRAFSDSP